MYDNLVICYRFYQVKPLTEVNLLTTLFLLANVIYVAINNIGQINNYVVLEYSD